MARATDKTTEPAAPQEKGRALRVRTFGGRFRRAGYTFGPQPRMIALADLTAEQIAQLRQEPMLAVAECGADDQ